MTPSAPLPYCPDLLTYTRRPTREVWVGNVAMGAAHPIRVQSMITADTRDTPACVAEILGLAEVGCEIVRVTAQTKTYAANLKHIAREVRAAGCQVPLVADIHFKPDAALEAAKWVEKVRINPGNYADKKKFAIREYSDAQYDEELERIREEFTPLVLLCKDLGRAMRIGTNHGSLSDRIMNRYGDTPLGMVESALEFARIARDHDYHALVFSMKASNPKVMIEAYRLLVARLQAAGPDWNYPIHLGVTEAGDGEDGRIKSAIGIGSLLADGIGDTIRVSLTEDSIHEVPVAQALASAWGAPPQESGWGVSPQAVFGASRPEELAAIAHTIRPAWNLLQRKDSTYLPHWRIPGATYAVTFRLDDAVPASALADYHQRKDRLLERLREAAEHSGSRSTLETLISIRAEIALLYERLLDPVLHQAHGACHLKHPELAEIVRQALLHFDGTRYTLFAWSVMSNHVHAVVQPAAGNELEKIVQSWKSFTAKQANEMLGLSGTFWQPEYYDHLIRDGEDFRNQIRYVLENPLRGKASARWTGSKFGGSWEEICGARRPTDGLGRDAPATLDTPATSSPPATAFTPSYNPFSYERRSSSPLTLMGHALGGGNLVRVLTTQERWNALAHKISAMGDFKPEIILEKSGVVAIDPRDQAAVEAVNARPEPCLVTVADDAPMAVIPAFRLLAAQIDPRHPILLKDTLHGATATTGLAPLLTAAQNLGALLCDGIGDAILVRGETAPGASLRLAYNILQAAGTRIFKTDYVACPSCGRTLFNLQHTTQKIRAATGHLKGVRIAVMGCIVNGPGEMADADFGYVGGAPGKINLYVGKTPVQFNLPEAEAVTRLTDLIRDHGKWVEPPPSKH
jgi:1-hydroxy-2-methyl-2-(E)-butenyl 4-diphosphate synthase